MPALANRLGITLLPNDIRGQLNRLRDLRNGMAHRGRSGIAIDRNEAAACLCAADFGVNYAEYARPLLIN